jgi:hypothetical protein
MSDIAKLKTKQHTYPRLDKSKYQKRAGLEGPFMTKSGQVVYYDNKKGKYLNPDNDMYLSYDDWKSISEGVIGNKWRKSAGSARPNLKIGNIELVRADNPKTGVHTIKKSGREIGNFSLEDDLWVVNIKGARGQGTYNSIDDIVKDLKKNKMYFEDAPANATGTAVAGTGDDSSTVVVKKKKKLPMQDKLMRRMGIKEAIDRAVPDLEYEEDEITKRANQLKELASSKYVGYEDAITSSNAYKYAEEKEKNWLKDLAINADKKLPYDKDTDQPKKYVAGLSDKEKKAHDRHLEKQGKKSDSDKSAYKQSPADKVAKTKPSVHTNKYKQMFGENDLSLDEAIKGLQNKAKKSGMPYSILKQVYNRGMAAWKGGHRPGTTPQQWAFARVNSFITKSSGTWGKADSDLAKKVRGS